MTTVIADYKGPLELSLVTLVGRLLDLGERGLRGLRVDLEGFEEAKHELAMSIPQHGKGAGVPQDVYEHFLECNETVDLIDELLPIAEKMVEVLRETRAVKVDGRQNDISLIVDAVRGRAQRRKDKTILEPFEKTIRYSGQLATKAMKTRRKNAEKAREEAEAEQRAKAEAEAEQRAKAEAEIKARAEAEAKAEAQKQLEAYKAEAEARASKEAQASAKREAEIRAQAEVRAKGDLQTQLEAYKAELEANFQEAVKAAVERQMAELGAGGPVSRQEAAPS